jgi:DNA-directed RNA polymerase specialized sigma24 family protein
MSTEREDRIERLLALLLMQQMKTSPQRERALQLSLAGFTNTEIADLLQTTAAVVAQSLYEGRRKPTKKQAASKRSR